MKLIVILRNPVDRAFSAYRHRRSVSREPLDSFEAALAAEKQRIDKNWDASSHYFRHGCYHAALEHYLSMFPRQQMHILVYEQDVQHNLQATMRGLFTFLNVDPDVTLDTSRIHNTYREFHNPVLKYIDGLVRHNRQARQVKKLVPLPITRMARNAMRRLRSQNAVEHELSNDLRKRLLERYREDIFKTQTLIERDLSGWFTDDNT